MPKFRFQSVALVALCPLLLATAVAAWQRTEIRARFAGYQLRSATGVSARLAAARKLLTLGGPGAARLADAVRLGPADVRAAVAEVVREADPTDPGIGTFAGRCGDAFASADPAGKVAFLDLVPCFLKGEDVSADTARGLVARGLNDESVDVLVAAISHAVRPEVGQFESAQSWLEHPSADVRRAAAIVLAPPPRVGPLSVRIELLFRRLHDEDEDVRALTAAGLKARGLSAAEIASGKRLVSPSARDRLELLFDLRWGGGAAKDPGPWLQRLAGDAEPAVRAGAVRVAVELGIVAAGGWVSALAERDPDPTVRRVAEYYRDRNPGIRPVGHPD